MLASGRMVLAGISKVCLRSERSQICNVDGVKGAHIAMRSDLKAVDPAPGAYEQVRKYQKVRHVVRHGQHANLLKCMN